MLARPDRRAVNRNAQRRWRERQKKCQASYRCDVDGAVLNMLVRRRYIAENEVSDAKEVAKAITLFLADIARLDE
jgi:hypothetical protein